jgi:hypothetical protein
MPIPNPSPDLQAILMRLTAIADTAPIGALGLDARTLSRALTLGYNQIGHIHLAPEAQLLADFGADGLHEILRALRATGLQDGAEDTLAGTTESQPLPLRALDLGPAKAVVAMPSQHVSCQRLY